MMFHKKSLNNLFLFSATATVLAITIVTMFISCQKDNTQNLTKGSSKSFFKSGDAAFALVSQVIAHDKHGEHLVNIEKINYLADKTNRYAMVFYKTNKRSGNMAFRADLNELGDEDGYTSYVCDGDCDCNVIAAMSVESLTFHCSCRCDLISHQSF